MLVAQHLDFDMARLLDVFLDEDAIVAEGILRLVGRRRKALRHFVGRARDAHALAAAAGRSLDHNRTADLGDRKSVVSGTSVTVRVDLGGRHKLHTKQSKYTKRVN